MKQLEEIQEVKQSQVICDQVYVFRDYIKLQEGITSMNYYVSLCHMILFVMIILVMETVKVRLLINENYFGFDTEEASKIIVIKVLTYPVFGYLCDKYGRKNILLGGYIGESTSLLLLTFSNTLQNFYIFWGLYIISNVSFGSIAFTADYVDNEFKGKATGVQYLGIAFGGILSGLYLILFKNYDVQYAMYGLMLLSMAYCVLASLYIKAGKYYLQQNNNNYDEQDIFTQSHDINSDLPYSTQQQSQQQSSGILNKCNPCSFLKNNAIVIALKKEGWLLMVAAMSFLEGSEVYIISTFIVMWAKTFYDKAHQNEADLRASILQTLIYSSVLLFSLLIGAALDKYKRIYIVVFNYSLMIIGCTIVIIIDNIKNILCYFGFFIVGFGIAGELITLSYLRYKYTQGSVRGKLFAFNAIVAALGGVLINFLSSFFFSVDRKMPFMIFDGIVILSVFMCLILYKKYVKST